MSHPSADRLDILNSELPFQHRSYWCVPTQKRVLTGSFPGSARLAVNYDEQMAALKEQELEHLRALLRPEHWPRIYELLRRVREEMRNLETSDRPTERESA
jgi:hypothetical protein